MSRITAALAIVLLSLAASNGVQARQLGSVGVINIGPWEPHHDGGFTVCTANLRKPNPNAPPTWLYHSVQANTAAVCFSQVSQMQSQGWSPNPNPGTGVCNCYGGFHGAAIFSGNGGGPAGEAPLSQEGEILYHQGLLELRERYNIRGFAEEHQMLLDSIRASEPPSE